QEKVRIKQESLAEVRLAKVRVRKVRTHQESLADVRPAEVRIEEERVLKVHSAEVRPAEVRPVEVLKAEKRPPKAVRKLRPAEVGTGISVLLTPLVPGVHALLEYRDVLVISHRSSTGVRRCAAPR